MLIQVRRVGKTCTLCSASLQALFKLGMKNQILSSLIFPRKLFSITILFFSSLGFHVYQCVGNKCHGDYPCTLRGVEFTTDSKTH